MNWWDDNSDHLMEVETVGIPRGTAGIGFSDPVVQSIPAICWQGLLGEFSWSEEPHQSLGYRPSHHTLGLGLRLEWSVAINLFS